MPTSTTRAARLVALAEDVLGTSLPVGLRAWDGSRAGPSEGPTLVLRSRRALRRLLYAPGELGLARAYVAGDVEVEGGLTEGLRAMWRSAGTAGRPRPRPRQLARAAGLAARFGALGPPPRPPAGEARLSGVLHSRRRDSSAIAHHYDLGNAFYELLLDESMAYSSGYWAADPDAGPSHSLERAQWDKLDMICRKLGLRPGMRLLDVGCGWGSLLVHAARHHGVRAVGVTLSARQCEHVRARVLAADLGDLVQVRRQDYRTLDGPPFDAVASVEMGEHVGADNYAGYVDVLHRMLAPRGRLLLQQMSRGDNAPGGGAFIERYIAPDMTMQPVSATLGQLERAGFEIRDVHAMREHYVATVRAWAATLEARWDDAVALIGTEGARTWRLYLAGGALAFEQNRMGVDQVLAARPDGHGRSGMAATRAWP